MLSRNASHYMLNTGTHTTHTHRQTETIRTSCATRQKCALISMVNTSDNLWYDEQIICWWKFCCVYSYKPMVWWANYSLLKILLCLFIHLAF